MGYRARRTYQTNLPMAQKRLTVYIDGRCLLRPRDGVGTYAAFLLEAILKLDSTNRYIALGFSDQRLSERLVTERANFS